MERDQPTLWISGLYMWHQKSSEPSSHSSYTSRSRPPITCDETAVRGGGRDQNHTGPTDTHLLHQSHPSPTQVGLIHHLHPHLPLEGELHALLHLQSLFQVFLLNQEVAETSTFTAVCHLGGKIQRKSFGSRQSFDEERLPVGEPVQDT